MSTTHPTPFPSHHHRPRPPRRRPADGPLPAPIVDRNRRVAAYQQLVRPVATHYAACSGQNSEDLIQVGLLGLIRAAELFSNGNDTPFERFARPHIRGAILHYLRDAAHPVRLPRRQEEQRLRLRRISRQMASCQDPLTVDRACCRELGIRPEQLQLLRQWDRCRSMRQLDNAQWEEIPSPEHSDRAEAEDEVQRARRLLEQLEPRCRSVVSRVVLSGWSYRKVAQAMAVSPMTVQRLLRRGLELLRQQMLTDSRLMGSVQRSPGGDHAPAAAQGR